MHAAKPRSQSYLLSPSAHFGNFYVARVCKVSLEAFAGVVLSVTGCCCVANMGVSTTKFTQNEYTGYYKPYWNGKCLLLESSEAGAINLMPVSLCLILIPCLVWTWVIPFRSSKSEVVIAFMLVMVWGLAVNALHKLFKCYTTEPGIIPFK